MSRHWEFSDDIEVAPPRYPWLRDVLLAVGIGLFLGITISWRIARGEWNDAVAAFFLFPGVVLIAIVVFEQIAGRRTRAAFGRLVSIAALIVVAAVGVTWLVA